MNSYAFEFPTRIDWKRIYNSSPFKGLCSLISQLENSGFGTGNNVQEFPAGMELLGYLYEVKQRLGDVTISYIFMMYYYEKGIPDKCWYISPSKDGHSVQYFPDFAEKHFHIKGWFDFYSDTFYYKLFSAWDSVGHMINVAYGLSVKKVSFSTAVKALNNRRNEILYKRLKELQNSTGFVKAKEIRNDIAHNYLPNTPRIRIYRGDVSKSEIYPRFKPIAKLVYKHKNNVGEIVPDSSSPITKETAIKKAGKILHAKTPNTVSLGLSPYITSDEIVTNAQEMLGLFAKTMEILLASTNTNNKPLIKRDE